MFFRKLNNHTLVKSLAQTFAVYAAIVFVSLIAQLIADVPLTAPNVNSTILVFLVYKVYQRENEKMLTFG